MRKILLLALIGLVAGVALGLLIGWGLWRVQYTNTTPAQLRQDYANDYVLMVAAAYWVDGDLDAARDRLSLLDPAAPARPVIELAEQLIADGGRPGDIRLLARLAQALGETTPALEPYLGAQP